MSRYSQWVERHLNVGQRALTMTAMSEPIINFEKVNKWYGEFHVLRDIDLSVAKGERIVICGPSGSGKSTLIRCINALEEHQEGRLTVDGVEITDDVKAIEAVRKNVGMVFQQFNLFPHLTVLENLTLAPMWVGRVPQEGSRGAGDGATDARAHRRAGRASIRCSCRAASSSAWRSRARCA